MPGAGTLAASNHVASLAPKDGTALALVARGVAIEPLIGGQGVRFEPLKLHWIGSTSQEVSVIAVRADTGVKTLDDAKAREVVLAASGGDGVTFPNALNKLLGTRFRSLSGYRSSAEMVAGHRAQGDRRARLVVVVGVPQRRHGDVQAWRIESAGADGAREGAGDPAGAAGHGPRQGRRATADPGGAAGGAGDGVADVRAGRGAGRAGRAAARRLSRHAQGPRGAGRRAARPASTSIRCRARRSTKCSARSTRRRRR